MNDGLPINTATQQHFETLAIAGQVDRLVRRRLNRPPPEPAAVISMCSSPAGGIITTIRADLSSCAKLLPGEQSCKSTVYAEHRFAFLNDSNGLFHRT
jgi:hypothetical protein